MTRSFDLLKGKTMRRTEIAQMKGKKLFVVSDLHMGDGGERDNFAGKGNKEHFQKFLDYVGKQKSHRLIVLGDLFEFWQANLSGVIVKNIKLLERLSRMKTIYVLGNHDVDLLHFIQRSLLRHTFFDRMTGPFNMRINKRTFRFMHGHEVDSFNSGENPSWGRMLTIFAGIFEDANGSPFLPTGQTVEGSLTRFGEALLGVWNWAVGKLKKGIRSKPSPKKELTPAQNPSRLQESIDLIQGKIAELKFDVAVAGHTHCLGKYPASNPWYFNSGHWTGSQNGFLRIDPDGKVRAFEWTDDGKAREYPGAANERV